MFRGRLVLISAQYLSFYDGESDENLKIAIELLNTAPLFT
jgi:hypothetical protein